MELKGKRNNKGSSKHQDTPYLTKEKYGKYVLEAKYLIIRKHIRYVHFNDNFEKYFLFNKKIIQ